MVSWGPWERFVAIGVLNGLPLLADAVTLASYLRIRRFRAAQGAANPDAMSVSSQEENPYLLWVGPVAAQELAQYQVLVNR